MITQVTEGEPVVYPTKVKNRMVCCDCNLAHVMRFTVSAGGEYVILRAWRDEKFTKQLRREKKKKR